MTEEEKAIVDSAESIVSEAGKQELSQINDYMKQLFHQIEDNLWNSNNMSNRVYDLCSLRQVHKGTPESLAEYKEFRQITDPDVESLWLSNAEHAPNACLALTEHFVSSDTMPPNIIDLFQSFPALIRIHEDRESGELVGLIARTKGTGRPVDADTNEQGEPIDVIITSILLGNFYGNIIRKEDGSLVEDQPDMMNVARYSVPDDKEEVVACAEFIGENHGRLAFAHYTALYMPMVMRDADPEMYEAMKQDALSSSDDEETTTNKEQ